MPEAALDAGATLSEAAKTVATPSASPSICHALSGSFRRQAAYITGIRKVTPMAHQTGISGPRFSAAWMKRAVKYCVIPAAAPKIQTGAGACPSGEASAPTPK